MKKQRHTTQTLDWLRQSVIATLCGGGATFALLYLAAILIVSRMLSQSVFVFLSTCCICVGCAISSAILACQRKSNGLLCGIICFCVFASIILACGWCNGKNAISGMAFLRLILLCTSACIGGCYCVNKAEKRARRRRKI